MRRRHLLVATLAVLLVSACGSTKASPTSMASPSAAMTSSALPSPSLGPTATPSAEPSPTPVPTPTTKELASEYLRAATTANNASDAAAAIYTKSSQTFTDVKRYDLAWAKVELAFIRAVQAIRWTPPFKPIAQRLISCDNQSYVYSLIASKAKDSLTEVANYNKADAQSAKCSAIANELRLSLGLPPVPIK